MVHIHVITVPFQYRCLTLWRHVRGITAPVGGQPSLRSNHSPLAEHWSGRGEMGREGKGNDFQCRRYPVLVSKPFRFNINALQFWYQGNSVSVHIHSFTASNTNPQTLLLTQDKINGDVALYLQTKCVHNSIYCRTRNVLSGLQPLEEVLPLPPPDVPLYFPASPLPPLATDTKRRPANPYQPHGPLRDALQR